ncbi:FtsX-like permease family protein [Chitinophaga niastensis]|uniref:FtsX-like permease family protein n=1 Tax=Chitinophaga niastensis TaxID=536980 RepID=A0A2P8HP99_CHINA|nr:ABC transporter permease [Chitinophaga niastensis]PSL48017.1 FtsX-like permease family protein [Chitinophaga niastensis]
MFKYNISIIWRNLLKDRQFTILNLLGLSTGLACSLFIWLWISDELNVDKYNEKDPQLYQVMANQKADGGIKTMPATPGLLAKSLGEEIPEVEHAVSVLPASWFPYKGILSNGDTHIKASGQYVGKDYFNVFTCHLIAGNKDQVLTDKSFVVISEELAKKLFHTTENIVGKSLKWDQQEFGGLFTISGIFKKNPSSATDQFDLLFNYSLFLEKRPELLQWGNNDPSTYVIVKNGTNIDLLNNKMKGFVQQKDKDAASSLFLTRFSDRYLHGNYENGVQAGGRITYVKLFSIIAILILMIACINFMNLSTAKASRRMKEIGIKKVMGASRGGLILQYLGESTLMAFLSLFVAIILIFFLLPVFNEIAGKQLSLHVNSMLISVVLGITILTGLLAGSYPAFYLSRFNPLKVLKGKLNTSFGELLIRKGLIVFQFTLSVLFIAAVLIVYKQLNYIQSKNLGYNRDNIIHFEIPLAMDTVKMNNAIAFVNELKNIPGVINTSSYYHNLLGDHGGTSALEWPGKNKNTNIDFSNLEVGYNFLETAGINIKEGRNFSGNVNSHKEIILNETAIKSMGLKDPVGKTIQLWGEQRQIVGIAADFNFESLYQTVKPCFFQVFPVMPNVIVKINGNMEQQTIEKIKQSYLAFNHGMAFDYRFLDDDYQALYSSEKRVGILSRYFAGLAIIISCLGLFGLSAFTAQRRQKEISIRKVVGASISSVAFLVSKEFFKLVLIAVVLAFLLVWWLMNNWLNYFAYRIHIGFDIFLITAATITIITLLTVSFQAIKAALANPVKNLRTE